MPAYRLPSPQDQVPLRRRASGLVLAVGVNILLLLALLTLGVIKLPPQRPSSALIVDFLPESHSAAAASAPAHAMKATARTAAKTLVKPPIVKLPTRRSAPPLPATDLLEMSKADLAAADISNLPKSGSEGAGDSEAVGKGPNGETLYAAEWARHPTDAELSGYLPRNAPDGWGLIACRTIPDDRVDDCIELGNDPPGSHLASAVRQAAWQFRVRPPRKNGVPMVGAWVRIRIDYERVVVSN